MDKKRISSTAADLSPHGKDRHPENVTLALHRLVRRSRAKRLFRQYLDHTGKAPRIRRLLRFIPAFLRPWIAEAEIFGHIDAARRHGLTIVSHELSASGAPKLIYEIARIALEDDVQPIVVSPTPGPFLSILVNAGAVVVIDPTVTDYFCASSVVLNASQTVLVNTAACFKTISRLDRPQRCIWYFHETDLIRELISTAPEFAVAVRRVGDVWAVGKPTKDLLDPVRPDTSLIPPGIRPLSVNHAITNDNAVKNPGLRLGLFGGVEPRKGHDIIAKAISELPTEIAERLTIRVYGSIKDPNFAERWLTQIVSLNGITYEGEVAPDRISDVLGNLHGVIIPSRDEPFSLVALEALSCGKLVLCSPQCGISEYLTDSLDAYIASRADTESFSRLLARVVADSPRWHAIGEEGRKVFFDHFTDVSFANRIRAFIHILRD